VVTPALEPVEQATGAVQAVPVRTEPVRKTEPARLDPNSALSARAMVAPRASRADIRRAAGVRPPVTAASRPTRTVSTAEARRTGTARVVRSTNADTRRPVARRPAAEARSDTTHRTVRVRKARATKRTVARTRTVSRPAAAPRSHRVMRLGKMTAVVAYARSQVGKRYVSGGEGPGGFDCSGFTKRAYAQAGIRLPHSSGAQAARARRVSRAKARVGDLVVGRGHVGIYMGKGMMIDAGNRRTGVVYRKLYSGLRVGRL
jgi:cell wall-associated NlpC family hydrolase